MKRYHLLCSHGGQDTVCLIEDEGKHEFTPEQKKKLDEKYGDYVVSFIHPKSIECFYNLQIVNYKNFDDFLRDELLGNELPSESYDEKLDRLYGEVHGTVYEYD
jgi:hypothetical protein